MKNKFYSDIGGEILRNKITETMDIFFCKSTNVFQYYFNILNPEQKSIYKKIMIGLETFSDELKLPLRPINEISFIFDLVLLDNPKLFFVSSYSYLTDLYKKIIVIKPNYKYPKKFVHKCNTYIKKYMESFDFLKSKNVLEAEKYVHDFCLNNIVYDNSFDEYSHSILGVIYNRSAVCEGISKFTKFTFDYIGINSLVVVGRAIDIHNNVRANELHAWNIIEINGNYTHLDVTFDMTLKDKNNRYDYFNLDDTQISYDHTITSNVPKCTVMGLDYFTLNSMCMHNKNELEQLLSNGLVCGEKYFMFKLVNVIDKDTIVEKIINIAENQYSNIFKCSTYIDLKFNLSQLVFEINYF